MGTFYCAASALALLTCPSLHFIFFAFFYFYFIAPFYYYSRCFLVSTSFLFALYFLALYCRPTPYFLYFSRALLFLTPFFLLYCWLFFTPSSLLFTILRSLFTSYSNFTLYCFYFPYFFITLNFFGGFYFYCLLLILRYSRLLTRFLSLFIVSSSSNPSLLTSSSLSYFIAYSSLFPFSSFFLLVISVSSYSFILTNLLTSLLPRLSCVPTRRLHTLLVHTS